MDEPHPLFRIFCEESGHAATDPALAAQAESITRRIEAAHSQARQRWVGVELSSADFARVLGQRARAQGDPLESLDALHLVDLYLAGACEAGVSSALATFDEALLGNVAALVARFRGDASFADEVAQSVRERLFLGGADGQPRISQYEGRAALAGWVSRIVLNQARNLLRAERDWDGDPDLVAALPASDDVELAYLKSRYRRQFEEAAAVEFALLDPEKRALLHLYIEKRITVQRLAVMRQVDHSTIVRRIRAAQEELGRAIRARLQQQLQLGTLELQSLMRLVRSQVGLGFLKEPE